MKQKERRVSTAGVITEVQGGKKKTATVVFCCKLEVKTGVDVPIRPFLGPIRKTPKVHDVYKVTVNWDARTAEEVNPKRFRLLKP